MRGQVTGEQLHMSYKQCGSAFVPTFFDGCAANDQAVAVAVDWGSGRACCTGISAGYACIRLPCVLARSVRPPGRTRRQPRRGWRGAALHTAGSQPVRDGNVEQRLYRSRRVLPTDGSHSLVGEIVASALPHRAPLSADLCLLVARPGPHLATCSTFRPDGPRTRQ